MTRPSRHITEAALGKLDPVDELLWANAEPPPSPYGDQAAPLRNRAGDIIRDVIPQSVWTQDQILAHFRAVGQVRDSAPRTRAVGIRHSRSLRRVFE
jgi:hypothetical protein